MCIKPSVIALSDIYPLRMCRMRGRKIADVRLRSRGSVCVGLPEIPASNYGASFRPRTIDDAPSSSSWSSVSSTRVSGGQSRPDRTNGAPLLANTRGGESTIIEGSGRFVGESPTGAIGRVSEDVADGVTLNLVNVPTPQAAKTILGDILSVKYTGYRNSRGRGVRACGCGSREPHRWDPTGDLRVP
jgi:hypothetical protein